LSGLSVEIDDSNGDAEFLQAIADNNAFVAINITYASGEVYQGTGTVAGEFVTASMSTTAAIELKGTGKLTKQ
jgi:osmotically-inducible protein OsmY